MRKRGLMFASLYHDKAYIVDCSAEESVYEKWRPAFMGVVKSVDFEKVVHELPSGNYRNFMAGPASRHQRRPEEGGRLPLLIFSVNTDRFFDLASCQDAVRAALSGR
jgi:hypothetical protein